MNWKGPILTDSGGFQIFSLGQGSVADEIKGKKKRKKRGGKKKKKKGEKKKKKRASRAREGTSDVQFAIQFDDVEKKMKMLT